jgi:hypothetical protein
MIRVANHLRDHALGCSDSDETNVFGRSAFNRYYYATFLIVRQFLTEIDPGWGDLVHKDVPDLLTTGLLKRYRNQLKKGGLDPAETEKQKSIATNAASKLAAVMAQAYLIRVDADYKPDKLLTRSKGTLELSKVKSVDAAEWYYNAVRCSDILRNVARNVGII